jgi:hypothetical protein
MFLKIYMKNNVWCCSIFSFLCSVLKTTIWPPLLFFFLLLYSISFDLRLLIIPIGIVKLFREIWQVISWRSVLLVEETGVSGENHRPSGISLKTIIYYINIMLICQISRKSLTIPMGIIRSRKSKDILYNSKKEISLKVALNTINDPLIIVLSILRCTTSHYPHWYI